MLDGLQVVFHEAVAQVVAEDGAVEVVIYREECEVDEADAQDGEGYCKFFRPFKG